VIVIRQQGSDDTLLVRLCMLLLPTFNHTLRHHGRKIAHLCRWRPSTVTEGRCPCYTLTVASSCFLPPLAPYSQEALRSVSGTAINKHATTPTRLYFAWCLSLRLVSFLHHHHKETEDLCQWQPSTGVEGHSPRHASPVASSRALLHSATILQEDWTSPSSTVVGRHTRTLSTPCFA